MMSYRTLNQIFYTNNKFDDPNEILRLEKYFMNLSVDLEDRVIVPMKRDVIVDTKRDVIKGPCADLNKVVSIVPPINPLNPKATGFSPRDRDALFWCIFAHNYGEMEYEMIRTNYGKRKVDEKMKIYTWLKDNKSAIKTYTSMKITNVMYQEMLSELMCVQSDTGYLSIIAFALYYKINIYLVNETKKTYLEFLGKPVCEGEEAESKCIIYRLDRGYRLSYESSIDNIESFLKLESYMKPLKAISNYKMCELEDIANSLGLDNKSSMKKPELYQRLTEYCVWQTK